MLQTAQASEISVEKEQTCPILQDQDLTGLAIPFLQGTDARYVSFLVCPSPTAIFVLAASSHPVSMTASRCTTAQEPCPCAKGEDFICWSARYGEQPPMLPCKMCNPASRRHCTAQSNRGVGRHHLIMHRYTVPLDLMTSLARIPAKPMTRSKPRQTRRRSARLSPIGGVGIVFVSRHADNIRYLHTTHSVPTVVPPRLRVPERQKKDRILLITKR